MTETINDLPVQQTPIVAHRYNFDGPARNDLESRDVACDYLSSERLDELDAFQELPKTAEQIQQLHEMKQAIVEYGLERGVDVSQRLPSDEDVRFYSNEDFDNILKLCGLPAEVYGLRFSTGQIIGLNPAENPQAKVLHSMNHEMVHEVSEHKYRLKVTADEEADEDIVASPLHRSGYEVISGHKASDGSFHMLTELAVEHMAREIEETHWIAQPTLSKVTEIASGWAFGAMPVAEEIVQRVAERQGVSADTVWDGFALGELIGDMKALRPLAETFGTEGMKAITHYRSSSAEAAGSVALKLGLKWKPPVE